MIITSRHWHLLLVCSKNRNRTDLGLFYSLTLENQTRKRAPHFT